MRAAVIDDDEKDRQLLCNYILRYEQESGERILTVFFESSLEFLEKYKADYDIIFLDIEMPGMNGLETAREIRRTDETAGIIFITNMAQYAIKGYEVNAIDFMVKPVNYYNFTDKLKRAVSFSQSRTKRNIILKGPEEIVKMPLSEIYYIEKDGNSLVYHTKNGEYRERGSMQRVKEKLDSGVFSECTSGCLVNLDHVERLEKDTILVAGDKLSVSRRMKKEFVRKFMDYVGGMM